MFRNIMMALILIMLFLTGSIVFAASGSDPNWQVITTTGPTTITFDTLTTEIYVCTFSTNTAFVNWTSSYTTTNDFVLGILDQTDVIEHVEEIRSSQMTISQSTPPVHIRVQWKNW